MSDDSVAKETLIHSKKAFFQSEARLLEELGERLVASAEVAVVELIKNSYDADASLCEVKLNDKDKILNIKDDGHGITEEEFLNKWMHIATDSKQKEEYSREYKRKLTGAKGIGRFAVRFLSNYLTLDSIAYDKKRKEKTRLVAEFDWQKFSKSNDIVNIEIPYKLYVADNESKEGTTLIVKDLKETKEGLIFNKEVISGVLKIISPLSGLDPGRFRTNLSKGDKDPGFKVNVGQTSDVNADENFAKKILDNYWARLYIDLNGNNLTYKIFLQNSEKDIFKHTQVFDSHIHKGLIADIRFFPRREGVFSNKGFNGKLAWRWIGENCGVKVLDHGFQIMPYGFEEDDWLKISANIAKNERDWQSNIMKQYYEIPPNIKKEPSLNPMLYLPANHQLIGAIYVEGSSVHQKDNYSDLIPSTDREGFLNNKAFNDLWEIIRAGVEMLAMVDEKEIHESTRKKRKRRKNPSGNREPLSSYSEITISC